MEKIIFVCHGSICRSPAAEFIASSLSSDYIFLSRATSFEEIGNDVYPPMRIELLSRGIQLKEHHAKRIDQKDFMEAKYIFYMDDENLYTLDKLFGPQDKILPIYHFTPSIREIEDPWYTGNYKKVVDQITTCVKDILKSIN